MRKKKLIICSLIVLALCVGIIGAQKLNSRYLKQKTYNDLLSLPTIPQRKAAFAKLKPAQKAEIWRGDLLIKMTGLEYEGTEKGKILRDLSDALFPDLFDPDKTHGNPHVGEFAETPEAKRFFEAMGRYESAFSPEETRLFCGTLGQLTNPAVEKAARDNALIDGGLTIKCDCNYTSYCTACSNYCQQDNYCTKSDVDCGCFWLYECNGRCPG